MPQVIEPTWEEEEKRRREEAARGPASAELPPDYPMPEDPAWWTEPPVESPFPVETPPAQEPYYTTDWVPPSWQTGPPEGGGFEEAAPHQGGAITVPDEAQNLPAWAVGLILGLSSAEPGPLGRLTRGDTGYGAGDIADLIQYQRDIVPPPSLIGTGQISPTVPLLPGGEPSAVPEVGPGTRFGTPMPSHRREPGWEWLNWDINTPAELLTKPLGNIAGTVGTLGDIEFEGVKGVLGEWLHKRPEMEQFLTGYQGVPLDPDFEQIYQDQGPAAAFEHAMRQGALGPFGEFIYASMFSPSSYIGSGIPGRVADIIGPMGKAGKVAALPFKAADVVERGVTTAMMLPLKGAGKAVKAVTGPLLRSTPEAKLSQFVDDLADATSEAKALSMRPTPAGPLSVVLTNATDDATNLISQLPQFVRTTMSTKRGALLEALAPEYVGALPDILADKQALIDTVKEIERRFPTVDLSTVKDMQSLKETAERLGVPAILRRVDKVNRKWEGLGTDLLADHPLDYLNRLTVQGEGARMGIKRPSKGAQFAHLPMQMWAEQALLSPRYSGQNAISQIAMNAAKGISPAVTMRYQAAGVKNWIKSGFKAPPLARPIRNELDVYGMLDLPNVITQAGMVGGVTEGKSAWGRVPWWGRAAIGAAIAAPTGNAPIIGFSTALATIMPRLVQANRGVAEALETGARSAAFFKAKDDYTKKIITLFTDDVIHALSAPPGTAAGVRPLPPAISGWASSTEDLLRRHMEASARIKQLQSQIRKAEMDWQQFRMDPRDAQGELQSIYDYQQDLVARLKAARQERDGITRLVVEARKTADRPTLQVLNRVGEYRTVQQQLKETREYVTSLERSLAKYRGRQRKFGEQSVPPSVIASLVDELKNAHADLTTAKTLTAEVRKTLGHPLAGKIARPALVPAPGVPTPSAEFAKFPLQEAAAPTGPLTFNPVSEGVIESGFTKSVKSSRELIIHSGRLYENPSATIAIREVIQNAIDALRGDATNARIFIEVESTNGWIRVTDNGLGMTPEIVRDTLIEPFKTYKPGEMASGGHGVGFALVLGNNKGLKVTTVASDKVHGKIMTVLEGDGNAWLEGAEGTGLQWTSHKVAPNTPTGTKIEFLPGEKLQAYGTFDPAFPEQAGYDAAGVRSFINPRLPIEIEVNWKGVPMTAKDGIPLPEKMIGEVQSDRANMTFYATDELVDTQNAVVNIFNAGMPTGIVWETQIALFPVPYPKTVIVDITPRYHIPEIRPAEMAVEEYQRLMDLYPFTLSRDRLHANTDWEIRNFVNQEIMGDMSEYSRVRYQRMLDEYAVSFPYSARSNPGSLPDGKLVLDLAGRAPKEDLAALSQRAYLKGLDDVIEDFLPAIFAELARLDPHLSLQMRYRGFGFDEKALAATVLGEAVYGNAASYEKFWFVNPLACLDQAMRNTTAGSLRTTEHEFGLMMGYAIVHELTHNRGWSVIDYHKLATHYEMAARDTIDSFSKAFGKVYLRNKTEMVNDAAYYAPYLEPTNTRRFSDIVSRAAGSQPGLPLPSGGPLDRLGQGPQLAGVTGNLQPGAPTQRQAGTNLRGIGPDLTGRPPTGGAGVGPAVTGQPGPAAARLGPAPRPLNLDAIRAELRNTGGRMSPTRLRKIFEDYGVDNRTAQPLIQQWVNHLALGDTEGIALANKIHFDYTKLDNFEKFAKNIQPFVVWPKRALPFFMEAMAEHPGLIMALNRYNDLSEEDTKGLPARYKWMISQGKLGEWMAEQIFGRAGQVMISPIEALVPYAGITGYTPPQEGGTPGRQIRDVAGALGFSPAPWVDVPMTVAGLYGDRYMPNVLRHSGLAQGLTGTNVEKPWQGWAGQLQEQLTGNKATDWTDYLVRTRLSEMSVEETGQPRGKEYETAKYDPNDPLYQRALQLVLEEQGRSSELSFFNPLLPRLLPGVTRKAKPQEAAMPRFERDTSGNITGDYTDNARAWQTFFSALEANPLAQTYKVASPPVSPEQLYNAMTMNYNKRQELAKTDPTWEWTDRIADRYYYWRKERGMEGDGTLEEAAQYLARQLNAGVTPEYGAATTGATPSPTPKKGTTPVPAGSEDAKALYDVVMKEFKGITDPTRTAVAQSGDPAMQARLAQRNKFWVWWFDTKGENYDGYPTLQDVEAFLGAPKSAPIATRTPYPSRAPTQTPAPGTPTPKPKIATELGAVTPSLTVNEIYNTYQVDYWKPGDNKRALAIERVRDVWWATHLREPKSAGELTDWVQTQAWGTKIDTGPTQYEPYTPPGTPTPGRAYVPPQPMATPTYKPYVRP